jgi:hypothetical protein
LRYLIANQQKQNELIACIILFAFFISGFFSTADGSILGVDSLSLSKGRSAMWRSLAFDGWGQTYNQEYIKAVIFAGSEISILLAARKQNFNWRKWKTKRRLSTDETEILFYETRESFYLRDRNKLLWWWLWLKMGCVLDAYVSGALSNFDTDWDSSVSIAPDADYQNLNLSLNINFDLQNVLSGVGK